MCQRRVPQLPARPRVAGPARPAAPGRPRASASRCGTWPRSRDARRAIHRAAARRAALATSACGTTSTREYLGARGRPVRDLPRVRARSRSRPGGSWPPSWSRRRGCGRATVARDPARVGRAGRRAPGQAQLQRAALGRSKRGARRWRTSGSRCTALPIVAEPPVGYGAIDPEPRRELFIRHALVRGRLGHPPRVLRATTTQLLEEVRGAGAPGPPARHPGRRRGPVRRSTTSASPPTWSPAGTSTAGGSRRGRATRTC